MPGLVLDGKKIRDKILSELKPRVAALINKGKQPCLAVVLVGDDPASQIYVKNKIKACQDLGIRSLEIRLPGDLSTEEIIERLKPLTEDKSVDGVLVQMPLPKHVDAEAVVTYAVPPNHDVDGFGAFALGELVLNRPGFRACTPAGIMETLRRYGIEIARKKAVVVGRSDIVGKPMALLLLHANATVSICHSKTVDLEGECRTADILVAAMGRRAFIGERHIKPGAVVIDVGIDRITERAEVERLFAHDAERIAAYIRTGSALVGDVEPEAMHRLSSAYTPVPGGVGPLTIAMLMSNTVKAAEHSWAT